MGSWPFVFAFIGTMVLWAVYNGADGFDPYPFILLNLFLSMIAGLQGAILLISAKRADSVSSEVAVHTLTNTAELRDLIEANTVLTETVAQLAEEIHRHVCEPATPLSIKVRQRRTDAAYSTDDGHRSPNSIILRDPAPVVRV